MQNVYSSPESSHFLLKPLVNRVQSGPTTKAADIKQPLLTRGAKRGTKKGTEKGTFLIPLFETRYFIQARVAQWIRAFASGAKGRRFDPCRGYHIIFINAQQISVQEGSLVGVWVVVPFVR